jgi:hypothetical protein
MFKIQFQNDNEFSITIENCSAEIINSLATNEEFFLEINDYKFYMSGVYDKVKFEDWKFLITKNTKKCVVMIYLDE